MSLKAKIEAVIYAAEEPVTLAQLVSLLGEEAQAELDALASQQNQQESLALEEAEPGDPDALNAETLDEAPPAPEAAAAAAEETEAQTAPPEQNAPEAAESAPEETPEQAAAQAAAEAAAATRARAQEARRLREHFRTLLDELIADYDNADRGLEIREVAGGFRLATKPEYHDAVRGFVKSLKPPLKLSLQALETLAVVAYKQPVTAPEISEIRGVDSGGVLGSLMARKLVATAGRKQVIGRPILYKTTKDFLLRFGLKDLNELPSIEEFEKMASEFADAAQEEIPMPASDEAARHSEEDATAGEVSEENASEEMPSASLVDPADNVEIDGRVSAVPPNYERAERLEGSEVDTPELDAEVQGAQEKEA